jgi:PPK2 family polyphosphate:nucleotide phosphotransferase
MQHDFLWRTTRDLPERGHIGIFNRSYYEEVLIVRVHPKVLEGEKLPPSLVTKNIWDERFEDIRSFERHLARNGTVIRKFFLHLSKKEQKQRFMARLDEPEKNWKFSADDVHERAYWDDYQNAFEDMIRNTATKRAPWYVIPADNKWFTHLAVAAVIVETLEELNPDYPKVDAAKRKELAAARKLLEKKD